MARQWPVEVGGGKGRCAGSLWAMGHLRATMGHLRLTIGYLKATVVRVTLGHFKVTIGYSISKHKANITELHPKVRQTCLYCICLNFILVPSLGED